MGEAPSARPAQVIRYTYEDFEAASNGQLDRFSWANSIPIVPIEAMLLGDGQVIAAKKRDKPDTSVVDLGRLRDVPSVESVVVSTRVVSTTELPNIRELLFTFGSPAPDADTLRQFTGLTALHAGFGGGGHNFDLEKLPAEQLQKLAMSHWFAKSLAPLERMKGLRRLSLNLFRDPLDALAKMTDLEYLKILGPAKSWRKLRECTCLREAHLIDVQIANLRSWNTWSQLRTLTLSGRGVKSIEGLQACQSLEQLTLLNLKMHDLSPLRELPRLTVLKLRMADTVDLDSVASIRSLRTFIVDSSLHDDPVRLQSLKPLSRANDLEQIVLWETVVEDGDLLPLAELRNLKRIRLASKIGGDVEKLRSARPDIEVDFTPADARFEALQERVGFVTIQRPSTALEQWSIFQDLTYHLSASTNYAAESRLKREIHKKDPELSRRLQWDTEAGAVCCYANSEDDIRRVATILNQAGSDPAR